MIFYDFRYDQAVSSNTTGQVKLVVGSYQGVKQVKKSLKKSSFLHSIKFPF